MVNARIADILVVTGGRNHGYFVRLLGTGKEFVLKRMHYAYQEGEGAIAEALSLAEPFVDEEREYVALGDNVIEWNICVAAESFLKQQQETRVILKEVPNPERFGVHHMETDRFVRIDEKPLASHPPYAATGFCFYDQASGLRYCLHIALY